jgi:demethylmenaquinone methyltransferase/2-methoxy-6-polyprenyl-1,4-benzoquinol methylase
MSGSLAGSNVSRPQDGSAAGRRRRARWRRRRKDWDAHVADLEQMAGTQGFLRLRDEIVGLAALQRDDRVLDIGAGTGLLALAIAPQVGSVCAVDISPAMCRRLSAKLAERAIANAEVVTTSAVTLPLEQASFDVVVSNYCFHHMPDADKERALREVLRVLRPSGRLVIGDMMFRVRVTDPRDRAVLGRTILTMLRRGPAGLVRLAKNAARLLTGRWEHPADVDWWNQALARAGFVDVAVRPLHHEGGIATARRPT